MRSLISWACVTALSLFLFTTVALVFDVGHGLIMGLCFGIGTGSAFGMMIASAVHASDRQKDRQFIQRFIYEHSQPTLVEVPDPLVLAALGRVTDTAVVGGFCCHCGSEHEGLEKAPFNPAFHERSPLCPIPYARRIYLEKSGKLPKEPKETRQLTKKTVKKLLPKSL